MSFILEALKKSEKKHEDTAVPNLQTVHGASRPVSKKRPMWPYLLVACLLLNAGILLWFLAPRTEKPVSPEIVQSVDAPKESPNGVVSPAVEPLAVAPVVEPTPASLVSVAEAPAPVTLPAREPVPAAPPAPSVVEIRLPADSIANGSFSTIEAETVVTPAEDRWGDERPVYAFADLPYEVQSRLPEIHVSVYAYSNDVESRLVRVNNRILREGSYLDVGLLLDEITPTGMVFTFEGYRFRVPK